jgi:hypothetical protein
MKVRVGVLVGGVDTVNVGETVDVKVGVDAGVSVSVAVRELVAVTASVVKASIGSTPVVLLVAGSPPVFGMMISGSCSSCVTELETINGRLNAIKTVARMTVNKMYSFVFTFFVP